MGMQTLDPQLKVLVQDRLVLWQVFSGLVHFNETNGTIEPDLAESWSVADDGVTYTFKIRDNVYFHNGDKFTAKDAAYSIERCKSPEMSCNTYTTMIGEVKAIDDTTLQITLDSPFAPFLGNLCYIFMVSEKEVTEQGDKFGTTICSGTGPYYVADYNRDQKIVLKAFDKYYKGEAAIKTVNFHVITDTAAGMISFESGDLDYFLCTTTDYARLQGDPEYKTAALAANHITYLVLNPHRETNPILKNEKLRQAMCYAIDKEEMNYAAFDGMGMVANYFYDPSMNVGANPEGFYYDYNPEKAKQLLAEAGYPDGVNVGKLLCFTGSHFETCATVLQAQWAKLGIQCELEWNEQSVALKRGTDGDMDMQISGSGCAGDYDDLRKRVHTSKSSAYVDYKLTDYDWEKLDGLLDQSAAEPDPAKRLELTKAHNDMFMQTATQIPLLHKCVTFVWDADLNVVPRHTNPVIYEWSWN